MDYKQTMNLPKTAFPMKANLAQREPGWMEFWERDRRLPALARGERGRADVRAPRRAAVRQRRHPHGHRVQQGAEGPHRQVQDDARVPRAVRARAGTATASRSSTWWRRRSGSEKMASTSQAELRKLCRDWAMRFVKRQGDEFKRLGVRGDFDEPYLTLNPSYEAGDVRVFADMYRKGMVYKGRKPIHWCWSCKTALAEAEIEYGDESSDSIYVKFWLTEKPAAWADRPEKLGVLIWTTTPWTLPANVAVTLAPDADYVAVKFCDGEALIMAEALVGQVDAARRDRGRRGAARAR